jgi:fructose transport system permease protein
MTQTPTSLPTAQLDLAQEFLRRRTAVSVIKGVLHRYPAISPAVVLVVAVIIFGIINPRFLAGTNLSLITQQVAVIGTLGVAQTLVILTAGIDLSVGATMVLSAVIMGQFTFRYGIPVPVSILCGLACGSLCGFINGWLVAHMRLPPFIVTLGTWQVYNSIKYIYSKNETIRGQDIEAQAPLLQIFGTQIRMGGAVFTWGVIFMIALVIFLWYVLNYTAWGRRLYAVGDDPDAADLAGVPVKRMLVMTYTLSGFICAVAGWVLIGRISLFGGRGSILGMIFGALIVGVFSLGLRLFGADAQWTYLLIGVLIIAAVTVDQWIRKVAG